MGTTGPFEQFFQTLALKNNLYRFEFSFKKAKTPHLNSMSFKIYDQLIFISLLYFATVCCTYTISVTLLATYILRVGRFRFIFQN